MSSTDLDISPRVSMEGEFGNMPDLSKSPYEGLYPTTPQYAAGLITDPVVCVPKQIGDIKAATAAADPELDPPGV